MYVASLTQCFCTVVLIIASVMKVSGQTEPLITQTCSETIVLKNTALPIYRTFCSSDDQHNIELTFTEKVVGLNVYDGDNEFAQLLKGSQLRYKSSKLCLTLKAEEIQTIKTLTLQVTCLPIDRSLWPVSPAILKTPLQ